LASLYFRGKGVAQDYAQAATWFRAAADRDYPPAQDNLAWMYYTGTGVTLDYSEAAKWAQRAAAHGYARAQVDLGYLYEQGKGVPLDYVSAYTWYKLAVAGGDDRGADRIKSLSPVMTQKQISEASTRAAQFSGPGLPRQDVSNSNGITSSFAER
jgi:TPR repeat protein